MLSPHPRRPGALLRGVHGEVPWGARLRHALRDMHRRPFLKGECDLHERGAARMSCVHSRSLPRLLDAMVGQGILELHMVMAHHSTQPFATPLAF